MDNISKFIFGKPITEIIKARTSVRTYKEQKLSKDLNEKLSGYMAGLAGPFHEDVRFQLVESDLLKKESDVKLGTYGVIKGASSFIAAAVGKGERNLEEMGYLLEKVILYAAALGLGTCWLAGTFTRGEFARAIGLQKDEILPAVSPVGYEAENKRLLESVMRLVAGSKNRKDWGEIFFDGSFGSRLSEAAAGRYAVPLEMVRLGPSASNKQPWRIVQDQGKYHFYLQHAKGYAKMLNLDIQKIDIGIAMCHFELTAGEIGMKGNWQVQDPHTQGVPEDTEYIVSWVEG